MLSLGQAAKVVGASKSTISRYIKTGKLSANTTSRGGYEIDPSELHRVFPDRKWNLDTPTQKERLEQLTTLNAVSEGNLEAAELRGKLSGVDQVIEHLKEQLKDTQSERDEWKEQAKEAVQTTQKLIEDQRERNATGWIDRVLGRFQK